MRRILVDTHVLIWLLEPKKIINIGKKAQQSIESSDVFVSSISVSEIIMKSMIGKLKLENFDNNFISNMNANELKFSTEHAYILDSFPSLVGHDPFDRMLLAQAKSEGMIFLTADKVLLGLGLDFVVDASI